MSSDPLTITVLDLDAALGGNADLMLGGGFGLYLKQLRLEQSDDKTLLPRSRWPRARTTQDIDLFLRAEIVADAEQMARYRASGASAAPSLSPGCAAPGGRSPNAPR